jgi:serine/threonine-protein kinase
MGRVDEAFDCVLGRAVAKKSLHSDAPEDRAVMLVAEAQTCAQLEHPSIVPVYDLTANYDGTPSYTMRVVRGRTLRDLLSDNENPKKEHTPFAQVLGIFRQVCLAVDYAHSKGVVHRDLKPDNVIVGEFGEVYVVDWGIAHVIEGSAVQRTGIGPMIAGTPAYMAPEQILGGEVDGRADVFALGVIFYEMVAGSRPFEDESIRGVHARRKKLVDVPPSRRAEQPDALGAITGFFDELILACLSPNRTHRPGRARVIAAAIDEFLDAERENAERERDAEAHVHAAEEARRELERLDAEAKRLEEAADAALAALPIWEDAARKDSAWALATRARNLKSNAAQAAARAETELMRAIGRVSHHRAARRALAALYFRQFSVAELAGDEERMTRFMDLARAYDDGDLALELANQGELLVEASDEATIWVQRYEPSGPLLKPATPVELGTTPTAKVLLASGSYLVSARRNGIEIRYPLVIVRAKTHRLKLRMPAPGEVPDDMVVIAGGPFLTVGTSGRLVESHLPDFALGRFPVTCAQYAAWLSSFPDTVTRQAHVPKTMAGAPVLVETKRGWVLGAHVIEGPARARIPAGLDLEVPVMSVTWQDAAAFAAWKSAQTKRKYRLPSDREWDKAMRGADGRPFPMGTALDPSFARLRDSRPEPPQPEPVGAFVLDESPYGVRDLAGGVGDWTSTGADGAQLEPGDHVGAETDQQVVWRGGTWSTAKPAAANNLRYTQSIRNIGDWIGFRLALSLDENGSSELITEPMKRNR